MSDNSALQADIAQLEQDLRPDVPVVTEEDTSEDDETSVSPATGHVHLPG